jgi:KUP system potassium uptake protein
MSHSASALASHGGIAHEEPSGRRLAGLSIAALGIVYGDIGTSPLYAIRECFFGAHAVPVTRENVLGILSLVFWTLVVIVTLKYHVYVIRADNRGEGGILALMALVRGTMTTPRLRAIVVTLGLFGAALLYGDGIITPAISVLGAVEGLQVAAPSLGSWIVPISMGILVGLFLLQRRGTASVGALFGPVIFVWFVVIAALGVMSLAHEPGVVAALNPLHAIRFFRSNGMPGFLALTAVFLVATGGEALYADLGHFGEKPIQIDWFFVVGPSLVLNYLGQGALVLRDPSAAANPFFRLVPAWASFPLLLLATAAAVIASQAIISGAFSLTRQAVQLGYLPRLEIIHTSATERGQIYVPAANWALMAATILLVSRFRSSSAIADAYGVAVASTMVITTILASIVARRIWRWSVTTVALVTGAFLLADLSFFGANMTKILSGGWFALGVAAIVHLAFTTWSRGRERLTEAMRGREVPIATFLADVERHPPLRVPGVAVFMTSRGEGVPVALLHNIKNNRVLHETVVLASVVTEERPHVPLESRAELETLGAGLHRATLRFGFMDDPDVPEAMKLLESRGLALPPGRTSWFLGRQSIVITREPGMARWRKFAFEYLARNAQRATAFFSLPANRVIEIGGQVEI